MEINYVPCQNLLLITFPLSRSSSLDDVDGQRNSTIGNDNDTPLSKQKGKFSSLGKIFKPWKWRKKKESSEKFKETSEGMHFSLQFKPNCLNPLLSNTFQLLSQFRQCCLKERCNTLNPPLRHHCPNIALLC